MLINKFSLPRVINSGGTCPGHKFRGVRSKLINLSFHLVDGA